MKDLDFDELDRAVSSLVESESAKADNDKPDDKSPDLAEREPSPPVKQRASGQYMDVVHPSSNMRTALSMPERPSRQVVSIVPASDKTSADDGLDTVEPPVVELPKIDDSQPDRTDIQEGEEADKPQDSPFLTDAKVEKRPLGAFSDEPVVTAPESSTSETTPIKISSFGDNYEPSADGTPFPPELREDVLMIESEDTTDPDKQKTAKVPDVNIEKPSVAAVEMAIPSETVPSAGNIATGSGSITQQYKEQPSSGNQNSGAIFDTNAYHKPITVLVKKKAIWPWIVWLIVLLLVGAGAGAAMYFFILPMF